MALPAALAYSHYATAALAAHPDAAEALAATLDEPYAWPEAEAELAARVAAGDGARLDTALRGLRRRVLLHTIARDLAGKADLTEVCGAMTRLAEISLSAALSLHHAALADTCGIPCGADGAPQELVVIGMGKLGGGELNVSSDIDLVFTYPEDGETDGARGIANREFFDRLGRRVIAALNDRTADGYVFRVDMRLRPYGDSGPLTTPFAALEQYLVAQGRAWERYAWLKARYLTGARHRELDDVVSPFVYRKYLDFDAYEGLRDIHRQIREQGKRRDYQPNIKLGPGGIREIEFTVQALQLVRGGREPDLRHRGTLPALAALGVRGLLPEAATAGLRAAYVFLRNLEHRLQYRDDHQTQTLPPQGVERDALALVMGFAGTGEFEDALAGHRACVQEQFVAVFGESAARPAGGDGAVDRLRALWRGDVSAESARDALGSAGFDDPASLAATLDRVRSSGRYLQLPVLSRQRFDDLLPQLLSAAATIPVRGADAQTVFLRLLGLLEAVSRRSAYLALLIEHPPLLPRLTQLMGGSAWAADFLTRHPLLLDELLDARVLLAEPDWGAWRTELARMIAAHAGDPERQMDALRHFKHAQSFRLLAQDLAGLLTVERLADHLSALADTILAATLAEVWTQISGADAAPPRFAVVGYGKLGGKELGYVSDLDLVFLYEDDDERAPVRYARLAQRMVTWLTSTTAAGPLYDIDLRLRPDGAAGMLVLPFTAFCRYQRDKAWTWEHQALTRARFVTGDAAIGAAFETERNALLRSMRNLEALRADVLLMRRKMLAGHPNATPQFDLKHDPGGMVDLEFAVQYLVLAHAHEYPQLTRNAGNIALLGMCGELGLVPAATAAAAADAYREYRRLQHEIRLTGAPHARVAPETQSAQRAVVTALWAHVFGSAWA
jgi:[glutamine synthetase] adenylyltransferase / [glutamine synthetase]-adenylyl-L-tyrosine phosphorylase